MNRGRLGAFGLVVGASLATSCAPGVTRSGALLVAPVTAMSAPAPPRLHVDSGVFVGPDDKPFSWRGITGFALVEQVAHGREAEARAFVGWARETGFTVVRVLAMADGLFHLEPADGVRALPTLLTLANEQGLAVEVVALADTAAYPSLDLDAHVAAVGQVVAAFPNSVIELANEPYHPTQKRGLADSDVLARLRARIVPGVAVAYGAHSSDRSDAYGAGDYVTVHLNRDHPTWTHVARVTSLGALGRRLGRPVINDEPIGAGERPEAGRRWDLPEPFFGLGLMSRLFEVGGTFLCEDCLWARVPGPAQRASARAFIDGIRLVPDGPRLQPAAGGGPVHSFDAHSVDSIHSAGTGERWWVVALGVTADPGVTWREGWRMARIAADRPGVRVWELVRQSR